MGIDITGLGSFADLAKTIISTIWPDKSKQAEAIQRLEELKQNGELEKLRISLESEKINAGLSQGQIETNKIEAASDSLFKSGWRPFIGWVCASSFIYDFIIRPLFNGLLIKYGINFPELDSATLTSLTFGLLGLGAFRSFDKLESRKNK